MVRHESGQIYIHINQPKTRLVHTATYTKALFGREYRIEVLSDHELGSLQIGLYWSIFA